MNGHHLILGELVDFITGKVVYDTHDERYRQSLARLLVNGKGFDKNEIQTRFELLVRVGEKQAIIPVDFVISVSKRVGMIVKYGPGSLVTRHRSALAASRLVTDYQIPLVVVTNGEQADVLKGPTGEVMRQGLETIPDKKELLQDISDFEFTAITSERAEMESRIIYCFEVDGSCLCDDTICKL